MSTRIKILGQESALPTTTGAATSFSEATVVRLVNSSTSADYVVTVVASQSGSVIGSFTLMRATSELLEKLFGCKSRIHKLNHNETHQRRNRKGRSSYRIGKWQKESLYSRSISTKRDGKSQW